MIYSYRKRENEERRECISTKVHEKLSWISHWEVIFGFSFFGCKNLYSSFSFICYFMPPSFFLLLLLAFLSFQPFSFSPSYFFLALPLHFPFPLPSPSSLLNLLFCLEISHMFLEANLHTWAWWLSSLKLSQWTEPTSVAPRNIPWPHPPTLCYSHSPFLSHTPSLHHMFWGLNSSFWPYIVQNAN